MLSYSLYVVDLFILISFPSSQFLKDQPWSAQDERQIRGRAHRQPQKKEVYCYHLLARDTADVILSAMARGKRTMMETFLSKESGQGLRHSTLSPYLLLTSFYRNVEAVIGKIKR